jgi:hypothetical protein
MCIVHEFLAKFVALHRGFGGLGIAIFRGGHNSPIILRQGQDPGYMHENDKAFNNIRIIKNIVFKNQVRLKIIHR